MADFDDRPGATGRQARALTTLKLARPVGAAFEYSNVNYNLLGLVIEAASGEPYAAYIQKHIFDPLEMRHSYTSKAAARGDGLARSVTNPGLASLWPFRTCRCQVPCLPATSSPVP